MDANQPKLAELAGVTKGAVNQWLSGLTKSIDAGPAFELQRKTGYSAEWVMFGHGPEKIAHIRDAKVAQVVECMERMNEHNKDTLVKISATLAEPENITGSSDSISAGGA